MHQTQCRELRKPEPDNAKRKKKNRLLSVSANKYCNKKEAKVTFDQTFIPKKSCRIALL